MDLYSRRNRWKLLLLLAALLIIVFSVMYTQKIATAIQKQEIERVKAIAQAYEILNNSEDQIELKDALTIITNNKDIPVIWATASDEINAWKNFDSSRVKRDAEFLETQVRQLKERGQYVSLQAEGIETQYLYYKDSQLLQNLRNYPLYQLVMVALFVIVAFIAYNMSRTAEQNRVWVGMAKETAHQLGTPLSSLSAWIEILKDKLTDEAGKEMVMELQKDVDRLELITERFSKIGSPPQLDPVNISDQVKQSVAYMSKRTPQKVRMLVNDKSHGQAMALAGAHLLEWVLENLLKNALDAMDGQGEITVTVVETHAQVYIDVKDTGKGIPRNKFKTIFEPGFSTKKRGWGLGLTLSKRIVEQYHKGEIFVMDSGPEQGTTFRIILNKS
jgi:signal transduction histidine kinase